MAGSVRPGPREVALRILDGLFGVERSPSFQTGGSGAFSLADFQAEGVLRVRQILERRGGAVLADSVGLGKTYIALALIEETLRDGGDVIVVVPAAVRGLWRRVLGRIPRALGRPRLVSHTQLARGVRIRPAPGGPGPCGTRSPAALVVVDEAHRFRNPRTVRYAALARVLVPGSRLLLITATPVNNRHADLLHLLRLFAPDDLFQDVGVSSLRGAFETADGGRDGGADAREEAVNVSAGGSIAAVIREVVVRRTRAMVRDRFGGSPDDAPAAGTHRLAAPARPRFPARAPPRVVRYARPDLVRTVQFIARLELAPYSLHEGGAAPTPVASGLIRLSLLKRLDSSPAAFGVSISRLHRLLQATLDAAQVGRILAPEAKGGGGRAADVDPLQLSLVELVADPARPDIDLPSLIESLERDLAVVRGLRSGREGHSQRPDPKQEALTALLDRAQGDRTVVFTEYRDTAEALWLALARRYRVGRVDGAGAWLGLRPAGRRLVVERFAPLANGSPPPPDHERVDILIATDVLAEGVNLQDARLVVSYDLPWNPVRLLQRIGRVDRLGSSHDVIVPYLFAPVDGLEEMLGLTRRLRRKLGHIATTVGAEHADDLLERLASASLPGDAAASALEHALVSPDEAWQDPVETLRTLWVRHRPRTDQPGKQWEDEESREGVLADRPPHTFRQAEITVPPDHPAATLAWVVLGEHDGALILLEIGRDGTATEPGERAAAAFARALDDLDAPNGTPSQGDELPFEAIRDYFDRTRIAGFGPPRIHLHDPGRRLARRIRTAVARAGSALDPVSLQLADSLLACLTAPLDPVAEERVKALLDRLDGPSAHVLLRAAESALGLRRSAVHPPPPGPPHSGRGATIRAALRIRASTGAGPASG